MIRVVASLAAVSAILLVATVPSAVAGAEPIELKVVAEQEVTVTNEEGQEEVVRVEPKLVTPGEDVIYTISYTNLGAEPADNVVITNPVPGHMVYLPGSADGSNTTIEFSLDGVSFDSPENLRITTEMGPKQATADDYTHVRWVVMAPLESGAGGEVSYRARLQ